MLTIIAFLLTILGSVNWLLIGLLQYDFVAGIFGYQASVFSRIIYIIIGASSVFLIIKLFKNKGSLPIWTWRNKKDIAQKIEKMKHKSPEKQARFENVESTQELNFEQYEKEDRHEQPPPHNSLFDEHFDPGEKR